MSEDSSSSNVAQEADICFCGKSTKLRTSRTNTNPGRRFWSCKTPKSSGGCDYFRWFDGGPLPVAASSVIGNLVRKLKDTEDNCVLLRQLLSECEKQNSFLKIMLRDAEMKLKEAEKKKEEAEQKSHRLKVLIKSMVAGCVICSVFKWISY